MLSSRGLEEADYILEMSRRKREQKEGKGVTWGKAIWLGRRTDKQELRLMGENV